MDGIAAHSSQTDEQKKKQVAEQIWLLYYNETLYEKGLITEMERNRMRNKINALAPSIK